MTFQYWILLVFWIGQKWLWRYEIKKFQTDRIRVYMCTFPHVKHKRVTEIIVNYDIKLFASYFLIPVMQSIYRNQGTWMILFPHEHIKRVFVSLCYHKNLYHKCNTQTFWSLHERIQNVFSIVVVLQNFLYRWNTWVFYPRELMNSVFLARGWTKSLNHKLYIEEASLLYDLTRDVFEPFLS